MIVILHYNLKDIMQQLEYFIILFVIILFFGFSSCNAGIYLAINALAYTEDNGNGEIVKRRLEVNWYGDEVYYLTVSS